MAQIGDLTVTGPMVDAVTGARYYRVMRQGAEFEFGIVPHPSPEGVPRWVMLPGAERIEPGEHSIEPYEYAEQAFEAGLRAAHMALGG